MADKDATIEIKVADNKMKVTANYIPPKDRGNPLSEEDILSELDSMNINTGIKHENIKTICSSDKVTRNIIISECIQPKVGEKARIKFYIEINKLGKARVREDGSVELYRY